MVSTPKHYTFLADGYTPNTFRVYLPVTRADAFKYMARYQYKGNPIGDLIKCYHYITLALERGDAPYTGNIATPNGETAPMADAIKTACYTRKASPLRRPLQVIACGGTRQLKQLSDNTLRGIIHLVAYDMKAYEDATLQDLDRIHELRDAIIAAEKLTGEHAHTMKRAKEVLDNGSKQYRGKTK